MWRAEFCLWALLQVVCGYSTVTDYGFSDNWKTDLISKPVVCLIEYIMFKDYR